MSLTALTVLTRAVRLTVGAKAEPRPGQVALCVQVSKALDGFDHAVGVAPTGSGKSFALLSAAAARCIHQGERILISTESLSLQKQILDKDAPTVIQAVEELGGRELRVAVLKGVNNYVDPRKLIATAALVTGVEDRFRPIREWISLVQKAKPSATLDIDGADFAKLRSLLMWSFMQYDNDTLPGDRHSCTLPITELEWSLVSASSAEATGEGEHWLEPKAVTAKLAVGLADIVVVNHTMLAIQAASGIPIVLGNKNYGVFHHILVDEAHALPDEVRAQGASEVSKRTMLRLMRSVRKVSDSASKWEQDGEVLANALDTHLRKSLGRNPQVRIPKDDDPLGDLSIVIPNWARRATRMVKPAAESSDLRTMLAGRRAQSNIDELCAAVANVAENHSGEARWIEAPAESPGGFGGHASAQSSPVDVSGKLQRNLWAREDEDEEEPVALGVGCVSATLPPGFSFQAGLRSPMVEYPSPFDDAYSSSALYIPSGADENTRRAITTDGQYGLKFDVKKHTAWAASQIVALVRANAGSALILSATGAAGKAYVEALRRSLPGINVLSQWDGGTPASLLHEWREDKAAVLVGTKSLMTGVDAPGETCSLVVLDRIPRKPSNAVDDARVESIVERGIDKYSADRMVYAADAALLEAQAVGRLIRSASDRGLVAVLDSRLLKYKGKAFPGYPEPTRQVYMKPLMSFGGRFTDLADATNYLTQRKLELAA